MCRRCNSHYLAVMLMFAVMLCLLPIMEVSAASKPAMNAAKITVAQGMSYKLKVKNSSAKVKWISEDKKIAKVTKNGKVTGMKDGKTIVKAVIRKGSSKVTLMSAVTVRTPSIESEYIISKGEKMTIKASNKYKGAKYKWISSDKKIAKINSKGVVTGISEGKAKITLRVTIPKKGNRGKKTITAKSLITVNSDASRSERTVSDESGLTSALKDASVKQIIIKTYEKATLDIPKGEYKDVVLVVDAPNADIRNAGLFKTITIRQIAADTWTENAQGNVFILDAAAGHIVIPADAKISEIRIINADSKFKLDVQGDVGLINIESRTSVDISISGTVGEVNVNARAAVSIDGKSSETVKINVGEKADGTSLNSNTAVEVSASSDTEINLAKGAEGSTVNANNSEKSVEVTNNTDAAVTVKTGDKTQNVDPGKNATIDGGGNVNDTTTPGGGSSGGGASPSGDLTREVTSFVPLASIDAGTYGSSLKSVSAVMAELPADVTGIAKDGNVKFAVDSWTNTDGYDPATAKAGYYTFTAKLGNPDKACTVKDGAKAIVKIWVKASGGGITYTNTGDSFEEVNHFEISNMKESADKLLFDVKYTGTVFASYRMVIKYYDEAGNIISQGDCNGYLDRNETSKAYFDLPVTSDGSRVNYSHYEFEISANQMEKQYVSVKDKIEIGKPELKEDIQDGDREIGLKFTVKNNSDAELEDGMVYFEFLKNGQPLGNYRCHIDGILAGDTRVTDDKIYWEYEIIPDSVNVYLLYAYAENSAEFSGEDGAIIGGNNQFAVSNMRKSKDMLLFDVNYTGDAYAVYHMTINYYDKNGKRITKDSCTGQIGPNETATAYFSLPEKTDGSMAAYSNYNFEISADPEKQYTSIRDKIEITDEIKEYETDNYRAAYVEFRIKNNSDRQVSYGGILAEYIKDGEVIGHYLDEFDHILGGDIRTVRPEMTWRDNSKPDKVNVYLLYANSENEKTFSGEDGAITDTGKGDYHNAVNDFKLSNPRVVDDKIRFDVQYSGTILLGYNIKMYYYNAQNTDIYHSNEDGYIGAGESNKAEFQLPVRSDDSIADYSHYNFEIAAYPVEEQYQSIKNSIDISTPDIIKTVDDEGKGTHVEFTVKNNSNTQLSYAEVYVEFIKDGQIIRTESCDINDLIAGDTKKVDCGYFWGEDGPDSANLYLQYAIASK